MKPANIVFIGAGSMSFGMCTFGDLFTTPELNGATLSLVDINEENLERMYGLALKMNEASGMNLTINKTVNRRDVLSGADYVISSIAIERCNLWKQDFLVPLKHGIKHCLGENGGPGALFFTLRTIPLIIEICRDMEELCPNAWFLNFSNPESRIVLAVNKYTKIKCAGFCHGLGMAQWAFSYMTGIKREEMELTGAGLNHFQCVTSVRRVADNSDLYPTLREADAKFNLDFAPLSRKIFRAFGYWITCSDDHMGEYLPYGYEAGMHGYDFDGDENNRVKMRQTIADIMDGTKDAKDLLKKSTERAVDAIVALHTGNRINLPAAIVYNDGAIKNLPGDLAVEIPVVVDNLGITKVQVGELPAGAAALMSFQIGAQQMSVEAAVHGDKQLALQALLVDPVINDTNAAVKILDELWEINKPYIKNVL
jgi:alpha-galactosidase